MYFLLKFLKKTRKISVFSKIQIFFPIFWWILMIFDDFWRFLTFFDVFWYLVGAQFSDGHMRLEIWLTRTNTKSSWPPTEQWMEFNNKLSSSFWNGLGQALGPKSCLHNQEHHLVNPWWVWSQIFFLFFSLGIVYIAFHPPPCFFAIRVCL